MKTTQKQPVAIRKHRKRSGVVLAEGIHKETKERRDWASINDREFISYAKEFIEKNRINGRDHLKGVDSGLYEALRKRRLIAAVIPESKLRNWSQITDADLIELARKFIEESNIKNRKELQKKYKMMYRTLTKRKIIDAVFPDKKRSWSSMTDEELVSFTRRFIDEKKIKNTTGLNNADHGLYQILLKRNLVDTVFPEKQKKRPKNFFKEMNGAEIITYAKRLIAEKGIKNRSDLAEVDGSLYHVLIKRNLLNAAFFDTEKAAKTQAIQQVVQAMKEF